MIQYPIQFHVSTHAVSGIQSKWSAIDAEKSSISMAIPPEFEGPGGGSSPEDLYALALLNCFAATFKVIAERSKLDFKSLDLEGTLTVDRDERGRPWMARFEMLAKLASPSDRERADRLLKKTSENCLIHHSVKTQIDIRYEILDQV